MPVDKEINRNYQSMLNALHKIADWNDKIGNSRLQKYGSYTSFEDPKSVKIAREAFAEMGITQSPSREVA